MFRPPNRPPPMINQQYRPPFMQQRMSPPYPSSQTGLKGLLSRFTSSSAAASGAGGSKLTNTLSNVQQVLNVAQQATPLIKEYGPMIKDAPKYISMIKALKEINKEDEDEEGGAAENNINNIVEKEEKITEEAEQELKQSQPKLFI